jgi:hypothetical protein
MPTILLEVFDREKVIPLLQVALERQRAQLELGIVKTRQRLAEFEQKYGGPLEQFASGSAPLEPLDRVEWEGEAEMLRRLQAEEELLKTIRICG